VAVLALSESFAAGCAGTGVPASGCELAGAGELAGVVEDGGALGCWQ